MKLKNIAIIAHVDHGKTTLVDAMLRQSNTLESHEKIPERAMDSNDLEKERGITILSKNTAILIGDTRINVVDTPGHADFGGEVERVLSMVDAVLLVVDAVEGPMPQTRFVTEKAFLKGLKPIVVINKMDRDGARPDWVLNEIFDLFVRLHATDDQLDFPVVYASGIAGAASLTEQLEDNLKPLFDTILQYTPSPKVDLNGPFQLQISTLDYSSYVGTIGVGRINRGQVKRNQQVTVIDKEGRSKNGKIGILYGYQGLKRFEVESAEAGDIIALAGIEPLDISDTLCDPKNVEALPALAVDEPTITMLFQVNNSPLAGRDGQFITSRRIHDRLFEETRHNVALRVETTEDPEKFLVSGRGELHLGILIETMRREGYELAVGKPHAVIKEIDGVIFEPWEELIMDFDSTHQGTVMENITNRLGELKDMIIENERVILKYRIPARGIVGFYSEFQSLTRGTGIMYHSFLEFAPRHRQELKKRGNGAMISNDDGHAVGFALFNLQERGRLLVKPQTQVYEGMLVGLHSRDNDLVVNPLKTKKLTNMRASGSDENILLTPPLEITLEKAIGMIEEDELVEVTPRHIRLRKKRLKESDRKRPVVA